MVDTVPQAFMVARKIYEIRVNEGVSALREFLKAEFGVPDDLADLYAESYNRQSQPEIVKENGSGRRYTTTEIFEALGLKLDDTWPRNVIGYYLTREILGPDMFDFEVRGSCHENGQVLIKSEACDEDGNYIRVGALAMDLEKIEGQKPHIVRKSKLLKKLLGPEIGTDLTICLLEADFVFPPNRIIHQLAEVIKRGLKGEEVLLTGIFCPDYSYESTGDEMKPYRYNFKELGDGVGLVALQFVRVVPHIAAFLDKHKIKFKIKLAIGDFEANDPSILAKVNLTREEFLNSCKSSLHSFNDMLMSLPMELLMFEQEWGNGRFQTYLSEAKEKIMSGDYGSIREQTGKNPEDEFRLLARSNKAFYCDWFALEDLPDQDGIKLVKEQGAEYAACSRIIAEDHEGMPIIQIAGDRPKMQIFNTMYVEYPTICTKRIY